MKSKVLVITTSVIGNALEWYEFALYGYFASVIAVLFFPTQDKFLSLVLTFGVFASGFLVRPLGAVLFGHIGDKYGRKLALASSVALITIPTTLIGFLPSYQTLGLAAPVCLTCCRLLQGIAISGKLTGTGVFLIESAPPHKRGFYGSLVMSSTYLGLLLGISMGGIVTLAFNHDQVLAYAWRIPFIVSSVFGLIAFILRMKCDESEIYLRANEANQLVTHPLKTSFTHFKQQMFITYLMSSGLAVAIYLIIGYLPTHFVDVVGFNLQTAMLISFIGLLLLTLLVPVLGLMSDQLGRIQMLWFGTFGLCLCAFPIFKLVNHGLLLTAILGEVLLVAFLAPIAGSLITFCALTFPVEVRFTGLSIGYNLSMMCFGGMTPLVALYISKLTGSAVAPAYYLVFCGILSLVGIVRYQQITN